MNDRDSRRAEENTASDRDLADEVGDEWLKAKSASSIPSPKSGEPITIRSPAGQTPAGKSGPQRIKRSPVKTTLYMVGVLMMLFSATMLPPMAMAWWYDGYVMVVPFAQTMAATLGLGLL
ncbi:MAG: hypothetical protein MUC53_15375, partial [Candidatus Contendobacter sp.]|nr:hypothetical protein [Candidatus Contendobacter sp.]